MTVFYDFPASMSAGERNHVHLVNMSHGHLLPLIGYCNGKPFVDGVVCNHCGVKYHARHASAHDHLREKHGVDWWRSHDEVRV